MNRLFLSFLTLITLGTTTQAQLENTNNKLKLNIISKSLLDSTISNTSKTIYTYDIKGNETTEITFKLNNNVWKKDILIEYTYDSLNRNIKSIRSEEWNETSKKWLILFIQEKSFDSNNNLIQNIMSTNANTYKQKINYTYDIKGNPLEILGYYYDFSNSIWTLTDKFEYKYIKDNTDRIIEIDEEQWTNSLNSYSKTIKSTNYGKNGLIIKYTESSSTNIFETTYDSLGLKIEEVYTYLLDKNYSFKSSYEYDEKQRIIIRKGYKLKPDINNIDQWTNVHNTEYLFNDKDQCEETLQYDIGYQTSSTINTSNIKQVNSYDDEGNCIKNIFFNWSPDLKKWVETTEKVEYFYSTHQLTGVEKIADNESHISVYPNPASQSFSIKTEGNTMVDIYNISGILVWKQNISGSEPISVSNLAKGLYIVKIKTEQSVHSEQLIVE